MAAPLSYGPPLLRNSNGEVLPVRRNSGQYVDLSPEPPTRTSMGRTSGQAIFPENILGMPHNSSPLRSTANGNGVAVATPSPARSTSPIDTSSPTSDNGSDVQVGEHFFRRQTVLGEGSYGQVWLCDHLGGSGGSSLSIQKVALKEVPSSSEQDLKQAFAEVQLLKAFEQCIPDELQLPRCVAYGTYSIPTGWCLRMALTVCPGEPLERFLKGASSQRDRWTAFSNGCTLAARLFEDLGPTFQKISHLAFHRDVNSHNILVKQNSNRTGDVSFWLIDFGLAVESQAWITSAGPTSWTENAISGDCRYWPPSSWIMQLYGAENLRSMPALCVQYQTRLDLFGLGITAMEIICLTCMSTPNDQSVGQYGSLVDGILWHWSLYWDDLYRWWSMLYTAVKGGGDVNAVQEEFISLRICDKIVDLVTNLRTSLQAAAVYSRDIASRSLFITMIQMLDENSTWGWQEVSDAISNWRSISYSSAFQHIDDNKTRYSPTRSPERPKESRSPERPKESPYSQSSFASSPQPDPANSWFGGALLGNERDWCMTRSAAPTREQPELSYATQSSTPTRESYATRSVTPTRESYATRSVTPTREHSQGGPQTQNSKGFQHGGDNRMDGRRFQDSEMSWQEYSSRGFAGIQQTEAGSDSYNQLNGRRSGSASQNGNPATLPLRFDTANSEKSPNGYPVRPDWREVSRVPDYQIRRSPLGSDAQISSPDPYVLHRNSEQSSNGISSSNASPAFAPSFYGGWDDRPRVQTSFRGADATPPRADRDSRHDSPEKNGMRFTVLDAPRTRESPGIHGHAPDTRGRGRQQSETPQQSDETCCIA